jgi:hypothetical protein
MQPITYNLVNKDSVIGFDKMELVAITETQFWFKCYYVTDFDESEKVNISLFSFDVQEYFNTIQYDYSIISK